MKVPALSYFLKTHERVINYSTHSMNITTVVFSSVTVLTDTLQLVRKFDTKNRKFWNHKD